MKLDRTWLGIRCEEFWFDPEGFGHSRAGMAALRSFERVENCDCRVPEATLLVSLAGTEKEWLSRFSPRARASIKNGERECRIAYASEESDRREFFGAHEKFARRAGLPRIPSGEEARLEIFLARDAAGALLHGCAFLPFPEIGSYRYRYGVAVGKSQANAALLFAGMRRAKFLGCEKFDLGGIIPDAAPKTKEERINFFKTQFGGVQAPVHFQLRARNPLLKLGLKCLQPVVSRRGGYRALERLAAIFS
jgi:hypothetical protein